MICPEKTNQAQQALLEAVVLARKFSYDCEDREKIAAILDDVEYLATMMASREDCTEKFGAFLASMAHRYKWQILLDRFVEEVRRQGPEA